MLYSIHIMSEPRKIEYSLLEKLIKEEKYEEAVLEGLKKAEVLEEKKYLEQKGETRYDQ